MIKTSEPQHTKAYAQFVSRAAILFVVSAFPKDEFSRSKIIDS